MNPFLIVLLVAPVAVIAFMLGGSGLRSWLLLLAALLVSSLGIAGIYLIEKGPQRLFTHLPFSATNVAWLGSGLALAGFGAILGLLTRACVNTAKKTKQD